MVLDKSEARLVVIAERVSSVFSVVGAIFIIITFALDYRFRKPINRLVFYASFGNLFANVATLISRSGILMGVNTPLCQFQAFLIQWFMPADAMWTFAMACNVFLTFFRQYDAAALRTLEWRYIICCYGLPFVPALVYCFIETADKGKFYGSANLWCWVSTEWNLFRIATFYGPVWVIIFTNMVIYIKVGTVVLKWRKQLVQLNRIPASAQGLSQRRRTMTPNPTVLVPLNNMQRSSTVNPRDISIHSQIPVRSSMRGGRAQSERESKAMSLCSHPPSPTDERPPSISGSIRDSMPQRRVTINNPASFQGTHRVVDANKATVSYCYTALLFFIALLVTWVPSTINRLYTLIRPNANSPFGLDLSSSFVLPLQGFWNTVIYIVTSLPACKALCQDLYSCYLWIRSERSTPYQDNLGAPPGMRRNGAALGSSDGLDSKSQVSTTSMWKGDSRTASVTVTEKLKPPSRAEVRDSTRSSKRADIMISFDGKKRVVTHSYGISTTAEILNPFETMKKEPAPPVVRAKLQDDEEGLTRCDSMSSSILADIDLEKDRGSSSDDTYVADDEESEKKRIQQKIGFAS